MAANYTSFVTQFPEFNGVPQSMVQSWLDAAALEFNNRLWGIYLDQGIYLLAAHKLSISPFGNNARLQISEKQTGTHTVYWDQYIKLVRTVTGGVARTTF